MTPPNPQVSSTCSNWVGSFNIYTKPFPTLSLKVFFNTTFSDHAKSMQIDFRNIDPSIRHGLQYTNAL